MNKIKAFFKLIRWPNLLMIILVQLLLQYMLIGNVFKLIHMSPPLNNLYFFLLMISTVFMAAFGYAFNDVQDIKIDTINKDGKRIIDVYIGKKSGLRIAWALLALALIPALYISLMLQMIQLFFIHIIIALGLWYYSVELKNRVLSGNALVSLFTALSIYIVWLYHLIVLKNNADLIVDARRIIPFLNLIITAYSLFAFIISLIRELIKDIEDKKGDSEKGSKTFAIVYGIQKTKILVYFLSVIMLLFVLLSAYYSYMHNWLKLGVYLIIAVAFPLVYFMIHLQKSKTDEDFGDLSTLAKIIMVAGILSIQILYISY